MSTAPRLPDDPGRPPGDRQLDRFVSEAFGAALDAPAMREGFAESLAESLDAEFAKLSPSELSATKLAALNGVANRGGRNGHDYLSETESSAANQAPASSGRRWARVFAAMAASILIAVMLAGAQPSYSWASMIEAMNQQPWVHTVATSNGAVRLRRWLAVDKGVEASEGGGRALLVVRGGVDPTRLTFTTGADRVIREPAEKKLSSSDWQTLLPGLLTAGPDNEELNAPAAIIPSESWRRVRGEDGRRLIELTVSLLIEGRSQTWVLLIDPETKLPLTARRDDADADDKEDKADEVDFSYPSDGPETISELGVPESAQVVSISALESPSPIASDKPAGDKPAGDKPTRLVPADPEPIGDPLPDAELTARVDQLLSQHWQAIGVSPALPASDEEFLRRVYLDLTGRIPTVGEARVFLEDQRAGPEATTAELRAKLVDQLLASRDHATHLAAVWRKNLIPASVDLAPYGGPERLDQWLADRFQDNLPYNQLAAELLLAEGRISESGPLLFYAALKLNPEEIAAQSSRVFLGMRLECAQCHDHPFDARLAQEDFWGFAALFAQISRPRGMMDVTSPVLRVYDNNRGEVTLPDTDTVVEPRLPLSDKPVLAGDAAPSRREQFVNWLVDPHNDRFAQATVNRVWAHLFGRGLVDPVDDIREENPAVSPELLDLLGKDFARSGYDLRRLLRQVVLSDAYQLSSASETDDAAAAQAFARMNLKSFTAEQLYDCIAVSTRGAAFAGGMADGAGLVRIGDASRAGFVQLFDAPGGSPLDYHAGIPQALTMMHGGLVHSATDLATSGLLKSLSAPFFNDQQRIETLFLATLSRRPSEVEMQEMSGHIALAKDNGDRQQRLGDVLWALLNTAEFTLNH